MLNKWLDIRIIMKNSSTVYETYIYLCNWQQANDEEMWMSEMF